MADTKPTASNVIATVRMTTEDMSQAIGEWLWNQGRLPKGMEEGMVNFKVEDGGFVIEVYAPQAGSTSIN